MLPSTTFFCQQKEIIFLPGSESISEKTLNLNVNTDASTRFHYLLLFIIWSMVAPNLEALTFMLSLDWVMLLSLRREVPEVPNLEAWLSHSLC